MDRREAHGVLTARGAPIVSALITSCYKIVINLFSIAVVLCAYFLVRNFVSKRVELFLKPYLVINRTEEYRPAFVGIMAVASLG